MERVPQDGISHTRQKLFGVIYRRQHCTAVKYGMDMTLIVLNNHELGKISKEQRAGHWPVWQTTLHNPGFAEFALRYFGPAPSPRHRLFAPSDKI